MDSIHSSPISVRLQDYSPDYDSSGECCSVCDEDSQDLSLMDTTATTEGLDQINPKNNNYYITNTESAINMNNSFNNYRNNLNLSHESPLDSSLHSTPNIAIISQNKCRSVSPTFDKHLNNEFKQSDIESQQIRDLKRKKSIIKRFYSNANRRKAVATRLSILGRPIPLYRMRNEIQFYREKVAVYNFLSRPKGKVAVCYHLFVSIVVSFCLLMTILSTISDYETVATNSLKYMDGFIVALFSSEFVARLWSCSCVSHYQGWKGKLLFLRNPFRLIDIFVIITSCIVLFFDTKSHTLFVYFRGFRFFQVFQMLRLEHRFRPWRLMASVVWAQREHLAVTTYMGFLSLLFISFLIYFVEKDYNQQFSSIASSMWWGVITLCTVGYGDMSPVTPFGKFLSSLCTIIGVSIFALPAGILGTGLALKVQEQQRVRQLGKRRVPAAKLIQWMWRSYAAGQNSTSKVTWTVHSKTKNQNLTNQEKNAIRFIRTVKYFIARRQFNTALKPYDIKDVLEEYAAGHADLVGRVKYMQSRLFTVHTTVNNNLKSQNETKVVLSSRITQMESIVSEMNNKISDLLELQTKDKTIINSLVAILGQQNNCDINVSHNLLPISLKSNKIRRNSF